MKLYHTIHTISINDFSTMLATENKQMACRKKLPKKFAEIAYNKIIEQYNELFNSGDISKLIESDSYKLHLYMRSANYFATLRLGVELYLKYSKNNKKEDNDYIINEFRQNFGHEPKQMADLNYIDNKIRKLNSELKRLEYKEKEKRKKNNDEDNKATFNDLIFFVKSVLNIQIDRSMNVYAFHTEYKNAKEQFQRMQAKK